MVMITIKEAIKELAKGLRPFPEQRKKEKLDSALGR